MTIARHIFILSFTIIFSCNIFTIYAGDAVPVLLWGSSFEFDSHPSGVNPFLKTSQEEFNQILNSKIDNSQPPILVFVKDSLCIEDITQHKEDLLQVTNRSLLAYLPAVQSPLPVFEDLSLYNQSYDDNIDSISDGQLVIKPIITLNTISEVYKPIKESSPNVIAALTGRSCSYSRSERVTRAAAVNNDVVPFNIVNERVLLYSSEFPYIKFPKDKEFTKLINMTEYTLVETNPDTISLQIIFTGVTPDVSKLILLFNFEMSSPGYYTWGSITYKPNFVNPEVLTPSVDIVFPYNFSYHCSQNIIFSKNDTAIKIQDLQVQIDSKSFSDAYDCVNFTTIPIWTGIFVTVILGLIMIWALAMIIDIRTMDRFDDPKGKTITISAQE